MVAQTYEVHLCVEKIFLKSFFLEKINFICSSQHVILFLLYYRYECFENKKTRQKGMTSMISSLVRIWKICHSYPGCIFLKSTSSIFYSKTLISM